MAYQTPPDFTAFDTLTAAELDILGGNDIAFHDGTGFLVTPARFVSLQPAIQVVDVDPSGTGSNSVDITANTSATAYAALINVGISSSTTVGRSVFVRQTGSGAANDNLTRAVQNQNSSGTKCWNAVSVRLDSSQSFDWLVDNADVNAVTIVLRGYWETVV